MTRHVHKIKHRKEKMKHQNMIIQKQKYHDQNITVLLFFTFLLLTIQLHPSHSALNEEERLQEYDARNYTFPPSKYVPNTPGWKSIMERRMKQISHTIKGPREKYNSWLTTMGSAVVIANFTEYGWGLTRAPDDLVQELKDSLYHGLDNARFEKAIQVLDDSPRAKFIDQNNLNQKVQKRLLQMHEEWSGITLTPSTTYGLRLYQNNSSLLMHTDKPSTHVISCILHVDHSLDSEPWPIIIEDYTGTTNEVYLESGDMLFYESSKCLHGRTKPFQGSWYTSVFVHYRPTYGWDFDNVDMENHYAVPPNWNDDRVVPLPPSEKKQGDDNNYNYLEEKLVIVGTGLKEPQCDDDWCALKEARKWYGPAKHGAVIDPSYDSTTNEKVCTTDNE